MDYCHFPPEAWLLDVGCGSGTTVEYLMNHYRLAASGVDISSRLLGEGKARDDTLPLARARAEHLPFGSGSLDGILCECVLSLLSEPGRTMREFNRVLRPGGKLVLSDIYLRGEGRGDRGQGEDKNINEEAVDGCLQGARSSCSVKKLLSENGFSVMLWEDHTPLLKELAARLVLAHGSMDALWGCSGMGLSMMAALRPGYYLMVARKK
jgi:SAM-dependent methyltransferase